MRKPSGGGVHAVRLKRRRRGGDMPTTNQRPQPPEPNGLRRLWRRLKREESGQNLLEYTLLLAAIALAASAFVLGVGQLTFGLFSIANSRLASASQ